VPRTLDAVAFPLRTQRLTIRRARPEDAAAIWAYRRLEPVARFMTALPGPLEDFRTTFTEPDRLGRTLVVELVDGTLVGDLMVRVDDAWAQTEVAAQAAGTQAEIGCALDPAHQGHGYATEAVRELLRLCFDDLGLRRVVALCFAANEPSWRLMERVGMRRETHTVRESLHRSGEWMDGLGYAILAEEWRARA